MTRAYQCPGCWSVNVLDKTTGDYECDCGERLTEIDLRGDEMVPASPVVPHGTHGVKDGGYTPTGDVPRPTGPPPKPSDSKRSSSPPSRLPSSPVVPLTPEDLVCRHDDGPRRWTLPFCDRCGKLGRRTPDSLACDCGALTYSESQVVERAHLSRVERERDEARRDHVPLTRLREWIENERRYLNPRDTTDVCIGMKFDALTSLLDEYERTDTDGD